MPYYSAMLKLTGKRCVVVGGGQVAERKIRSLLNAEGAVLVVSPDCTEHIKQWVQQGKIEWRAREFCSIDIQEASLVIAATDNPAVNRLVYESISPNQWINIVDQPELSTFIVPSVIQRGNLQISISTGGDNPGLAKKLKNEWEKAIGPEYEEYVDFLGKMRREIIQLKLPPKVQRALLSNLLDPCYLDWTREGRIEERDRCVRERMLEQKRD